MTKFIKSLFKINEKKPITRNPSFYFLFAIPLVGCLIFGYPVWSKYDFHLNLSAYKNFLEISKMPLGVLSLEIPLVGFYTYFHKSKQSSQLMFITNSKNIDDLYDRWSEQLLFSKLIINGLVESLEQIKPNLAKGELSNTIVLLFNDMYELWKGFYGNRDHYIGQLASIRHVTALNISIVLFKNACDNKNKEYVMNNHNSLHHLLIKYRDYLDFSINKLNHERYRAHKEFAMATGVYDLNDDYFIKVSESLDSLQDKLDKSPYNSKL